MFYFFYVSKLLIINNKIINTHHTLFYFDNTVGLIYNNTFKNINCSINSIFACIFDLNHKSSINLVSNNFDNIYTASQRSLIKVIFSKLNLINENYKQLKAINGTTIYFEFSKLFLFSSNFTNLLTGGIKSYQSKLFIGDCGFIDDCQSDNIYYSKISLESSANAIIINSFVNQICKSVFYAYNVNIHYIINILNSLFV